MTENIVFCMIVFGVTIVPFGIVGLVGCIVRPDVFKF